jgi:hypothetical protein
MIEVVLGVLAFILIVVILFEAVQIKQFSKEKAYYEEAFKGIVLVVNENADSLVEGLTSVDEHEHQLMELEDKVDHVLDVLSIKAFQSKEKENPTISKINI